MPRRSRILLAAAALFAAGSAHAGLIIQHRELNFAAPLVGQAGNLEFLQFERFDTSLGRLDSVDVTMRATFVVDFSSLAGAFVPGQGFLPYSFNLWTDFSIGGLDFIIPSEVIANGVNLGANTAHRLIYDFTHQWSYTETTDLLGIAQVSSSGFVSTSDLQAGFVPFALSTNRRSDFEAPIADIPLILTPQFLVTTFSSGPVLTGTAFEVGSFTLTYNYTEHVQVAAPSALALLGAGLLGLFVSCEAPARSRATRPRSRAANPPGRNGCRAP